MENLKHTQGEWTLKKGLNDNFYIKLDRIGFVIAEITGHKEVVNLTNEEAEANAKLIATAPELLTALIAMVDGKERNWKVLEYQARQVIQKAIL